MMTGCNNYNASTVGIAFGDVYQPIERTAFGEVTNNIAEKYDFFTGPQSACGFMREARSRRRTLEGKPHIGELGYSFFFRDL